MTTLDQLAKGDEVTIARTVTVSSVDKAEGTFMTTDNRTIRIKDRMWDSTELPKFEITNHVKGEPENWPPKAGQVWEDADGRTYHVLGTTNLIYTGDRNVPVATATLKKTKGIHLVFSAKDAK